MTERDLKAERDLAADLRKIAADQHAFLWPMRMKALIARMLVVYTEPPRPTRETSRRLRAPTPRAKRLTALGWTTMAQLDRRIAERQREADERAAIAGATAVRHAARDGAA